MKHLARVISIILITLISLTYGVISHAQNLLGQQVGFVGNWNDDYLEVKELEREDLEIDPSWGKVEGWIDEVDNRSRTLRIGPIFIEWNDLTEFKGISRDDLAPKQAIEVEGQLVESAHLTASSITAVSISSSYLEIMGIVTESKQLSDGSMRWTVLGVPVEISRWNYFLGSELEERLDDLDMEEMFTTTLFNRSLAIGLELENNLEFYDGLELSDEAEDDLLFIEQILTLEVFYSFTDEISFFLGLEILVLLQFSWCWHRMLGNSLVV